jgi:hypothetical protein
MDSTLRRLGGRARFMIGCAATGRDAYGPTAPESTALDGGRPGSPAEDDRVLTGPVLDARLIEGGSAPQSTIESARKHGALRLAARGKPDRSKAPVTVRSPRCRSDRRGPLRVGRDDQPARRGRANWRSTNVAHAEADAANMTSRLRAASCADGALLFDQYFVATLDGINAHQWS